MSMAVLAESARVAGRSRAAWDGWLLGAVLALLALGVVMVHSASVAYAARTHGFGSYFLLRHVVYVALGLGVMALALRLRVRVWEKAGPYLLLGGIVLLVLVLLPGVGVHVNGASRWIKLGFFTLQPAELVKLFMVLYVAGYLVRKQEELKNFTQGILMVSIVVAVVGMLLLQEPDFGSVVVICTVVLLMLFLGGVRFWHFGLVLLTGIGGMVLLTIFSPYRMGRVTSFMDPWADPFGSASTYAAESVIQLPPSSVTPRANSGSGGQPTLGPIIAKRRARWHRPSMRSSVSLSSSVPVDSTLSQRLSSSASSVTRTPSRSPTRSARSSITTSCAPRAVMRGTSEAK